MPSWSLRSSPPETETAGTGQTQPKSARQSEASPVLGDGHRRDDRSLSAQGCAEFILGVRKAAD